MSIHKEKNSEFTIIDKTQKDFGENLNVPYGLLYQYRTNDGFWAIIDSDAFWATNARFSNDREEQRMGIEHFMSVQKDASLNINKWYEIIEDCYILCFCREGDILSQWRGYAEEGISVGYDFGNIRPFKIGKENVVKLEEKECYTYYSTAYEVIYLSQKCSPEEILEKCKLDEYISANNNLSDVKLKKKLKRLFPYLKHEGFIEEKECRIVFFNDSSFDECIQYRSQNGMKIPYLNVSCGNHLKAQSDDIKVRISFSEKMTTEKIKEFKKKLEEKKDYKAEIVYCRDKDKEKNDATCYGCTNRRLSEELCNDNSDEIGNECIYDRSEKGICEFIVPFENKIILSEGSVKLQKIIYYSIKNNILDIWNEKCEENEKILMWCDGHLPIREIIVGPCMNQSEKQESIKHYCKKHYWLNYVNVKKSEIPYRK